jgi:phosphopantetheinyl transferase
VIGARLECDPAQVIITVESNGRPEVAGVAFSLSHSADRAAIAIAAPSTRIGVDLESVRPRAYLDRLALRVFAPDEYARWQARPRSQRPRAFAQRWTVLEAVLTASGTGSAGGLASGRVPPPRWSCVPIDAGRGYAGAVAVDTTPIAVAMHQLRLGDALTRRGGTAR